MCCNIWRITVDFLGGLVFNKVHWQMHKELSWLSEWDFAPSYEKYRKGTSIRQEPEFSTSFSIMEKHMEVYQSGWMICNYTIGCWPTTSSNILIVDHNSVKGLKVCIVLGAEYWCLDGVQNFTAAAHLVHCTFPSLGTPLNVCLTD